MSDPVGSSRRDFALKVREQLAFIDRSCRAYDEGHKAEAVRIATAARVLFHDAGRSRSLMTHLGQPSIRLLSIAEGPSERGYVYGGLTQIHVAPNEGIFEYEPRLGDSPTKHMVSLEQWWLKDAVFLLGSSRSVNRRQIVLDAANKDGGAHVDAELSKQYRELLTGAGMTMQFTTEDGVLMSKGPDFAPHAALRQMGYELLHSPDLHRLGRNR